MGREQGYESAGSRAGAAVWALYGTIAAAIVMIVADAHRIDRIDGLTDGTGTIDDLGSADDVVQLATFLQLAVLAVAAVFFVRWVLRSVRNMPALGVEDPRWSPSAAGWAWFIPILSLWRPKQVVNDLWRSADPDLAYPTPGRDWTAAKVPALMQWWWGLWLVGGLAWRVSGQGRDDSLDSFRDADNADIFGNVLMIVAAILAMAVVRRVTARQDERAAALTAAGIAPGTPPQPDLGPFLAPGAAATSVPPPPIPPVPAPPVPPPLPPVGDGADRS
jgi:hypothetical protein